MVEHRWVFCDFCGCDAVICGKCGNNSCNGGYGEVDGKQCDECPSAYEMAEKRYKTEQKGREP